VTLSLGRLVAVAAPVVLKLDAVVGTNADPEVRRAVCPCLDRLVNPRRDRQAQLTSIERSDDRPDVPANTIGRVCPEVSRVARRAIERLRQSVDVVCAARLAVAVAGGEHIDRGLKDDGVRRNQAGSDDVVKPDQPLLLPCIAEGGASAVKEVGRGVRVHGRPIGFTVADSTIKCAGIAVGAVLEADVGRHDGSLQTGLRCHNRDRDADKMSSTNSHSSTPIAQDLCPAVLTPGDAVASPVFART
jgi:hypothetical protein